MAKNQKGKNKKKKMQRFRKKGRRVGRALSGPRTEQKVAGHGVHTRAGRESRCRRRRRRRTGGTRAEADRQGAGQHRHLGSTSGAAGVAGCSSWRLVLVAATVGRRPDIVHAGLSRRKVHVAGRTRFAAPCEPLAAAHGTEQRPRRAAAWRQHPSGDAELWQPAAARGSRRQGDTRAAAAVVVEKAEAPPAGGGAEEETDSRLQARGRLSQQPVERETQRADAAPDRKALLGAEQTERVVGGREGLDTHVCNFYTPNIKTFKRQ